MERVREREECVCVCVCESKRERESERGGHSGTAMCGTVTEHSARGERAVGRDTSRAFMMRPDTTAPAVFLTA